ncbi:putative MFS family arabinose efflux permease [Tumebacillus sp. BK434]|uniref:MFS transporter n=1 Tax=Tumebacillus sp. BK434 TaxID=2512169 RepID=UPI0010EEAFF9|nr:MFS transporter [Tumebacillus sp. BK434]TCP53342.1 putative MFS family arabinose efflux permease [Tumebacillus sp. BK434]
MNYLAFFRTPHLVWLWLSQFLSAFGDQLYLIAITWLAVQQMGSSAGLLTGAGTVTALLLGLFGGAYADRFDRRKTMIVSDLLRALLVGLLPLSWYWFGDGTLWPLMLAHVLVAALGTLFQPALQASLPVLCREQSVLYAANALIDSTHRFARILGPGLTGLLLLWLALPDFFLLDAMTYLVSGAVLLLIGKEFPSRPPKGAAPKRIGHDIRTAWHLLLQDKLLLLALSSLAVVNVAWGAAFMIGAPLLSDSASDYGLIVAAYGIGNVLSLLVTGGLAAKVGFRAMFLGQLILGAGFAVMGIGSLQIAMLGAAIAAFGSPIGDLLILGRIQTGFPPEHVGKLYSIRQLFAGAGLAVGLLLAAPLYQLVTPSTGILLCALLIVASGLYGLSKGSVLFSTRQP